MKLLLTVVLGLVAVVSQAKYINFYSIALNAVEKNGTAPETNATCSQIGELRVFDRNCTKFQVCYKSNWVEVDCPTNFHFDGIKKVCKAGKCSNDKKNNTISKQCTNDGDIKQNANCTKFDVCFHNEWVEQDCPNGFHFDGQVCRKGPCPDEPTTTTTDSSSTTTPEPSESTSQNSTSTEITSSSEPATSSSEPATSSTTNGTTEPPPNSTTSVVNSSSSGKRVTNSDFQSTDVSIPKSSASESSTIAEKTTTSVVNPTSSGKRVTNSDFQSTDVSIPKSSASESSTMAEKTTLPSTGGIQSTSTSINSNVNGTTTSVL